MSYGERFEEALVYTVRMHETQVRKGTGVPYVTHLLAVASLVGEAGGSEDEVIAALLHDGPEDQGGRRRLDAIRRRFGDAVADIVEACTDTFEQPKPDWKARKEKYLAHLETAPRSVLLVSCADKLHNARAIVSDVREKGEGIWAIFKGGREGTLWYYQALVEIYRRRGAPARLLLGFTEAVAEMVRL